MNLKDLDTGNPTGTGINVTKAGSSSFPIDPKTLDPTHLFVPKGPRVEISGRPGEPTAMLTRNVANPLPPPPPKVERVLVKAQNVHDYFMTHHEDHGWMKFESFFCVRPPYPQLVIVYDHETNRGGQRWLRHVDVIVQTMERQALQALKVQTAWVRETKEDGLSRMGQADGEVMLKTLIDEVDPDLIIAVELSHDGILMPGHMFVMADATGQVLTWRDGLNHFFIRTPSERKLMAERGIIHDEMEANFQRHTAIALAVIQFMHCRNVEVLDNAPTRQQRRTAERAGARPPVTYKTLVIHPIGKKRARPSGPPTGEDKALHICRGHFKDYRAGSGLGKWHRHGIWWWDAQVRGSADRRVVKDYDVEV
jgi:hypothetical protein